MKIKSIQFETWFDENIDEWFDPKNKIILIRKRKQQTSKLKSSAKNNDPRDEP
jgi:hypothetical protein